MSYLNLKSLLFLTVVVGNITFFTINMIPIKYEANITDNDMIPALFDSEQ